MGKLEQTTDLVGGTSQTDLNAQDISNLIDEFNRSQDQLDSLANSFTISLSGIQDLPALSVAAGATDSTQQYIIPHNLGYEPAFLVYIQIPNPNTGYTSSFPGFYYVGLTNVLGLEDAAGIFNNFYVGVDDTNLYLSRGLFNSSASTEIATETNAKYYILQQPSTVTSA